MRLTGIVAILALVVISIAPVVSGTVQAYSTDLGKVQIDIPFILFPASDSNGDDISLAIKMPGVDPSKRYAKLCNEVGVMAIHLANLSSYEMTADDFVAMWMDNPSRAHKYKTEDVGLGVHEYEVQENYTNDGHKLWFYTETSERHPSDHSYWGFIDYQKEKNHVVFLIAGSSVTCYKTLKTFDKAKFLDVCKSFTFVKEVI